MTNPTTMDSPPPETPEPRQASIQDPPPSADSLAQPSAEQPPSGLPENPACTECASREVQPSRSVYPLDHTRIGGEDKSFWRCSNCGARFLAQKAPEGEKRRRRSKHDPLEGAIQRSRKQKQWIFPLLVVLATILAVMYVLDRRSAEAPAFTFPDR